MPVLNNDHFRSHSAEYFVEIGFDGSGSEGRGTAFLLHPSELPEKIKNSRFGGRVFLITAGHVLVKSVKIKGSRKFSSIVLLNKVIYFNFILFNVSTYLDIQYTLPQDLDQIA